MRSDLKISIVIPLYQKAAHIERCLDSVLASLKESESSFEIIVVDDGSTDRSGCIALAWFKRNLQDNYWLLISTTNRGASSARNTGWRAAKNEIIMFIDADDKWRTSHVSTMLALIHDYPEANLYGTGWDAINPDGSHVSELFGIGARVRGEVPSFFVAMATGPMFITSSSSAARKSSLEKTGGFPEGISLGEDKVAWCRLAANGSVAFDPSMTVTWHKDADNRSDEGIPEPSTAYLRALEEALQSCDSRPERMKIDVSACVEAARIAGFISIYDDATPVDVMSMLPHHFEIIKKIRAKARKDRLP